MDNVLGRHDAYGCGGSMMEDPDKAPMIVVFLMLAAMFYFGLFVGWVIWG